MTREADLAKLVEAVSRVEVLDVAGRVLASPTRYLPSQAAIIAMAHVIDTMWPALLEASLLVNALDRDNREALMRVADITAHQTEFRRLFASFCDATVEPTEKEESSDAR